MKEKMTLQQKLAKRQYKIPGRFLYSLYYFIMVKLILPKYRPNITVKDNIGECSGPCFLIWNHLSRLDHVYVLAATYPRRVNIVAGYVEFFRSHLKTVFRLNRVLPKKIYSQDIPGVKAMLSIVKQGGCVAFSPEGMSSIYGQNQPIVPGTGRFLKHFGIPVYFLKLKGQYLTNTKHCLDVRPGRTEAELSLLLTAEQLKSMTAEEIDNCINEAFRHDDFAWSRELGLTWRSNGRICEKLDDICYRCPRCGAEFSMDAAGSHIRCRACGNGADMDDGYCFHPFDDTCRIPVSPPEWVAEERRQVIIDIRKDNGYCFSEECELGYIPPYRTIKHKRTTELCGGGKITFDHKGIHFKGEKCGEPFSFSVSYAAVYSLPIETDTSHFGIYVNEDYYEFYPKRPTVGKMLLITEEMHRLHVNQWKNFPWFDYLYESVPEYKPLD